MQQRSEVRIKLVRYAGHSAPCRARRYIRFVRSDIDIEVYGAALVVVKSRLERDPAQLSIVLRWCRTTAFAFAVASCVIFSYSAQTVRFACAAGTLSNHRRRATRTQIDIAIGVCTQRVTGSDGILAVSM